MQNEPTKTAAPPLPNSGFDSTITGSPEEPKTNPTDSIAPQFLDSSDLLTRSKRQSSLPVEEHTTDELPTILGYEITKKLGNGGMGVVYLAKDELEEEVALKIMLPKYTLTNVAERFKEEAKALRNLVHPNITRIFNFGFHENRPFFTLPLLLGGDLSKRKHDYAGDYARVLRLMIPITDAIAYLHSESMVHRDLKPANILFDKQDKPYVSDFGLVKLIQKLEIESLGSAQATSELQNRGTDIEEPVKQTPNPMHTQEGDVLGTLSYMSPEQTLGKISEIGPATDIWALGVILYELSTGKHPFFSTDKSVLRSKILDLPLNPPSGISNGFPPQLEAIISKCLQKPKEDRYTSVKELKKALETFLSEIDPTYKRSSEDHPKPIPQPEPKPSRFKRRLGIGIALLGICGIVTLAMVFAPKKRTPLEKLQDEFARTGKLELITPDTKTFWSQNIVGNPTITRNDEEKCFTIDSSNEISLVELMNGLPEGPVRIEMQIRHTSGKPDGHIGLYLGRSTHQFVIGEYQAFLTVTLNDWSRPKEKDPRMQISGMMCATDKPQGFHYGKILQSLPYKGEDGWHSITVEFDSPKIRNRVDTNPTSEFYRSDLLEDAARWHRNQEGMDAMNPSFREMFGLGLVVSHGTLSIQNVQITRIVK